MISPRCNLLHTFFHAQRHALDVSRHIADTACLLQAVSAAKARPHLSICLLVTPVLLVLSTFKGEGEAGRAGRDLQALRRADHGHDLHQALHAHPRLLRDGAQRSMRPPCTPPFTHVPASHASLLPCALQALASHTQPMLGRQLAARAVLLARMQGTCDNMEWIYAGHGCCRASSGWEGTPSTWAPTPSRSASGRPQRTSRACWPGQPLACTSSSPGHGTCRHARARVQRVRSTLAACLKCPHGRARGSMCTSGIQPACQVIDPQSKVRALSLRRHRTDVHLTP